MRVLITGAGGGIGHACSKLFAEAGWDLVVTDRFPGDWMSGAVSIVGDIASKEWATDMRSVVDDGLDCVVLAHGVDGAGALSEMPASRFEGVVDVNFLSATSVLSVVAGSLEESNGVFVAISSQAGLIGEAGNAAYCASKFALAGWVESVAAVFPQIRFRNLCPGVTKTPMLERGLQGIAEASNLSYDTILARRIEQIPVGRLGEPEEIAAAALMLAGLRTKKFMVTVTAGGEVMN